jgi:pimeloyl-ACP methyl ester carboxylesterase
MGRPPEPHTQRVAVEGGLLHVGVWPGAAPVLVAIHGGTSTHRIWAKVARALAGAATVIAPDFRGAGGSFRAGPPFGLRAHADDVRRLLDHVGVERAILAGWSLGGFIATNAAALLGARVRALVLVDGGVPLALPEGFDPASVGDALIEPALARYRQRFASREAHRAASRAHPALARPGLWDAEIEAAFDDELEETAQGLAWRVSLDALRADVADTLAGPTRDALFELRCPVSFVWAERGILDEPAGYYPLALAERLAARPGMRVAHGHGQNHWELLLADAGVALVAAELRHALAGTGGGGDGD